MKAKIFLILLFGLLLSCSSTTPDSEIGSLAFDDSFEGETAGLTADDLLNPDLGGDDFGDDFADFSDFDDFDSFGDFGDASTSSNSFDESFTDSSFDDFFGDSEDAFSADSMDSFTDDFAFTPDDSFAQDDLSGGFSDDFSDDFSFDDSFAQDSFSDDFTSPASSSPKVDVTALDFLANQNGGTISIATSGPTSFTTRTNLQTRQFIVELENANLPQRFQRPYNTSEFNGAIGLFEAYQNPGGNVARFVIQLNEDNEPLVQQEGNNILIVASREAPVQDAFINDDFISDDFSPSFEDSFANQAEFEPSVDMAAVQQDQQALSGRTLEDLLAGDAQFYGRRINIEVKDWQIRDVFDFIAEQSGLNIVLSEEVKGTISLKLREIPWDQALVVVMQANQLGYKRQGNIIRIAPLTTLRAETDAARQVIDAQRLLQPTQVKIIPVSYSKARDLERQVRDFLTPNRGKVQADERTNSLVITDIPEVIKRVEELVNSLDTQTPQVLIEARVVEAKESFQRRFGIDWTAGRVDDLVQGRVGGGEGSFAGAGYGQISFGRVASGFLATLGALEREDMIKILSSPRVLVLNNTPAKIEQIQEIPVVKVEQIAGGGSTTTIDYIPVTLALEVTPQVTSQGSVIMKIDVKRDFAGESETVGENAARPIFKRSANTTVVVNNGETTVIGGIYQSDNSTGNTGVPILSRIPILGYLFKQESVSNEKNELMMFVTPRIMNLDRIFANESSDDFLIQEQNSFL